MRRALSAAAAAALVISGQGLAVQLTTMSASASSLSSGGQVDRIALDLRGEFLGACQRAVGDDHALDARGGEMAGGEANHLACADHQRVVRARNPRRCGRARLTVAEASETALAPIRVSERTRLAAENAA